MLYPHLISQKYYQGRKDFSPQVLVSLLKLPRLTSGLCYIQDFLENKEMQCYNVTANGKKRSVPETLPHCNIYSGEQHIYCSTTVHILSLSVCVCTPLSVVCEISSCLNEEAIREGKWGLTYDQEVYCLRKLVLRVKNQLINDDDGF